MKKSIKICKSFPKLPAIRAKLGTDDSLAMAGQGTGTPGDSLDIIDSLGLVENLQHILRR